MKAVTWGTLQAFEDATEGLCGTPQGSRNGGARHISPTAIEAKVVSSGACQDNMVALNLPTKPFPQSRPVPRLDEERYR